MDLESCLFCGSEMKNGETTYKLKKSTKAGYRTTPLKMHHLCFIQMLWNRDGFDIIVPDETWEYITIGEKKRNDSWTYDKVWKLGKYVLTKHTQEEFDHYEILHFRSIAKKQLTRG